MYFLCLFQINKMEATAVIAPASTTMSTTQLVYAPILTKAMLPLMTPPHPRHGWNPYTPYCLPPFNTDPRIHQDSRCVLLVGNIPLSMNAMSLCNFVSFTAITLNRAFRLVVRSSFIFTSSNYYWQK